MLEARRRLVHAGTAQQESSWTRLMFAMEYTGREKLMVLL